MKLLLRAIAVLFVCLFFYGAKAQVQIEHLSFGNALEKAAEQAKVLMVIIDSKWNKRQNDTVTKVLRTDAAFIINKQAVVIRPLLESVERDSLFGKYFQDTMPPHSSVGVLFFNSKGEWLHAFTGVFADPNIYFNHAFLAKRLSGLPNQNLLLEQLKTSGYTNTVLLANLIDVRRELSQADDDLLAAFIGTVPVDSFNQFHYFQVLARLCPVLHSKGDSILKNSKNFTINWNALEPGEQQFVRRTVNNKTFEKAVATKDYPLARYLIDSTINNGLENAQEKDYHMLRIGLASNFYWRVQDTAQFMQTAAEYADNYLMKLSIDSMRREFDRYVEQMRKNGQPFVGSANGAAAKYGSQLNFNAWQIYRMTNNSVLLQKALGWIKRAIQMNETGEANGAYAVLLYKTGERDKGISVQKKVIKYLKQNDRRTEIAVAERRLERMKMGLEKIED
jgi:hypothetical protein